MAVATVQFMSGKLWREVTYTALVPDPNTVGPGPYPVLLQLHGGNQNYSSWLHYSTLRAQVAELPLIVVLPDGAQSRWANGGTPFTAYEDFLVHELPNHIRHLFPATDGRWAIGGNSMGGGVAARFAEEHADRLTHLILVDAGGMQTAFGDKVPLAFRIARIPVINRDRLLADEVKSEVDVRHVTDSNSVTSMRSSSRTIRRSIAY